MRWFGEPWGKDGERAPVCEDDALKVPVPRGQLCAGDCGQPFEDGDQGIFTGAYRGVPGAFEFIDGHHIRLAVAYHLDCFLEAVVGPETTALAREVRETIPA